MPESPLNALNPTPETGQPTVVAPETPEGVFAAVENALHQTFGSGVESGTSSETSATFGAKIAGTDYSFTVNVVS